MGYPPVGCQQPPPPARRLLGAGGPGPAMSAHLAMPPYLPYSGPVRYGDYYWLSAGSMDSVPAEEAPAADVLPFPAAEKTPSHPGTLPARFGPGAAMGLPSAGGKGVSCVPCVPSAPGVGGMPPLLPTGRRPGGDATGGALLRRLPRWKRRRGLCGYWWSLCPGGTGRRWEQRRVSVPLSRRVPVPTSPRSVACGAPASPQGSRGLKFSREAELRSLWDFST